MAFSPYRIAVIAGIAVSFALRLYRLGTESLWYDETVSAFLARQSLPAMLAHTAVDIHPPGYYALLHGWVSLTQPFGGPALEFLLAFPSAVFGVIGIALLVPIGRILLGDPITAAAVWLAAINPFLIWYGQEVRMYTVAGALALLCLLAALQFVRKTLPAPQNSKPRRSPPLSALIWLAVYVAAGAAGMYVLYYFAFALLAINIAALVTFGTELRGKVRIGPAVLAWLAAQFGILVLFSPWFPLFVRQVLHPPVPPWRVPWQNMSAVLNDTGAALASYLVGQSIPSVQGWFWALMTVLILIAYYDYAKNLSSQHFASRAARLWLPIFVLAPPVLIFLVNALFVPIFHVRYLSLYAPAFTLIIAAALWYLYQSRRVLFALISVAVVLGSAYSMSQFWRKPDFRPDDHRAAVALLAKHWRPGDVIVANAGWVYTAIDTYWPSSLHSAYDALPPAPVIWSRLTDPETISAKSSSPLGVMTGSIDGDSSLGWGSDNADFYAISSVETEDALNLIGDTHQRIWHYRLYDTVNDPDGLIRRWFDTHQELQSKTSFTGTGNLTLEEYSGTGPTGKIIDESGDLHQFEDVISVADGTVPEEVEAGAYLYVPVRWQPLLDYAPSQALAVSLRLADADGTVWAQHDEGIPDLTFNALGGGGQAQVLALPIPVSTPPGDYDIHLVAYRPDDLIPLQTGGGEDAARDALLGSVHVQVPQNVHLELPSLASFDYLELVQASIPASELAAGKTIHLDLVWRPARSSYQDAYRARVSLVDEAGTSLLLGEDALGPAHYPSSMWPAGVPVRDQVELSLPESLAPGDYQVWLEVLRESDGLPIRARRFRQLPLARDGYEVGTVIVGE